MRAASRLFASVKAEKFLEPNAPTGLTGLLNHPNPRSRLMYLYTSTLDKLQQMPESSVYRQATEALTIHRLKIIEAAQPKGFREWKERVQYLVDENPNALEIEKTSGGMRVRLKNEKEQYDHRARKAEWDGEEIVKFAEGPRPASQRAGIMEKLGGGKGYNPDDTLNPVKLDPEPRLTAEQYVSSY
jgi:NADH dehydrogenase (ubiquinone) 1 alpha subcomplex subunit 5